MNSKASSADVPGRLKAKELARACAGMTRESYITTRPHPLLIQREPGGSKVKPKPGGFATLVTTSQALGASGPREESWAYEVAKRPGANAFSFLITLGRTRNNDLVVDEACVSKFHASFKKDPAGRWTVTDMSSNGIKLDGVRIPREQTTPLASGAVLLLAEEVELVFLLAPEAFDYLRRLS
jgi:hypothetical protein